MSAVGWTLVGRLTVAIRKLASPRAKRVERHQIQRSTHADLSDSDASERYNL